MERSETNRPSGHGALPLRLGVLIEHEHCVGRNDLPGPGLEFGLELAGGPAGIAQREEALARAGPGAHGAENLGPRRHGDAVLDYLGALDLVVRRMQDESPARLDRPSKVDAD